MGRPKESIASKFWKYVTPKSPGECWEWQGSINTQGYGVLVTYDNPGRKFNRAHRLAYEIIKGIKIPDHLYGCHKCDNRKCVNPDHIFIGTHLENQIDCNQKGRHVKGETCGSSKLNSAEAARIKELYSEGKSAYEIHKMLSGIIGYNAVLRICQNKTWRHV